MIRRPPRSTLFPTRRSSDLQQAVVEWFPGLKEHMRLAGVAVPGRQDRKSTRLNSSHVAISYAVFCLKKKKKFNIKFHMKRMNEKEIVVIMMVSHYYGSLCMN